MRIREVAGVAGAGVAVLGIAACSAPEPALGGTTASVSIDGNDSGVRAVRCHQTGPTWYIETPEQDSGFTAVLQTGSDISASSVNFRDVEGFTGSFWNDNIGDARVSGRDGRYVITGTAAGSFADEPGNAVSANFRIEAAC